MKFKRILFYFALFIFHFSLLSAQEHLVPLKCNPVLVRYTKEAKRMHSNSWRLISDSIMAKLPFLDDFSKPGPYPFDSLWMDNAAFINNTYPTCPHTLGVATLDGVNSEGQPYNKNCPVGASYAADSLTSRPIDLFAGCPKGNFDSVWLSFYYQAGGKGYAPKANDTLLLQFRTSSTPWTTVWYHLGYTPSLTDTGMHLVMIKMVDTIHYNGVKINIFDHNFQFRFKNYACTSANVDQWNIDEVYLNKNRSWNDTAQYDVSFMYESPSLLANYEAMPWEQFTQNDLKTSMYLQERNNNYPGISNAINTLYNYSINTTPVSTYSGGNKNIYPYFDSGCNKYTPQVIVPIKSNFSYTPLTKPTDITITHSLSAIGDFDRHNDTLRYDQKFSDYYAYDDGTAEAAYFINGTAPMYLAYQFTLNHPDTLRGLDLDFNYIFVNQGNYSFRLALWDNTGVGGSPGTLKFEDDKIYNPQFVDSMNARYHDSLNGFTFYPYHFSHDSAISGTFYVGWVQTYGDSLNIGYDYNTDHHNQIYYNVGSGWTPGSYPGSMMMRPVFGTKNSHSPILNSQEQQPEIQALAIYPNPAREKVTLSIPMPANTTLKIYTADGREWLTNNNFMGSTINTASLPAGFYIIQVATTDGKTYFQKLLIQR